MQFVELMLMAAQTVPALDPPTAVNLTTYGGSLVQVNWTNANGGTKKTRIYRTTYSGGTWTLLTTLDAGVTSYQTGDSAASNYVYGAAHYDAVTGQETYAVEAADLPPSPPTGVTGYIYSGTKKGVEWVNAEDMAVRCYRNGVLVTTKTAGATAWDSGFTSGILGVSHYNSTTGQESAVVEAGGA